jgi:uncharacterized protein YqeY
VGLFEQVTQDLTQAMKSGNKVALSVLRMLKSELKYKQIELKRSLSDDDCIAVLSSAIKKRQEAIESFAKAGRTELAANENAELEVLKTYQPQQLSDSELEQIIDNTITETGVTNIASIGQVMKNLMPKVKGKSDGRKVNEIVRKKLGG